MDVDTAEAVEEGPIAVKMCKEIFCFSAWPVSSPCSVRTYVQLLY